MIFFNTGIPNWPRLLSKLVYLRIYIVIQVLVDHRKSLYYLNGHSFHNSHLIEKYVFYPLLNECLSMKFNAFY
jgi:hypothetical protein